jgi:hypothetical protein
MSSPLLPWHVALLALVAANLVGSVFWLRRTKRMSGPASLGGVVVRAASLVYATAATLTFAVATLLFVILEISSEGRAAWRVNAQWPDVKLGMTAAQVDALLGQPLMAPRPSDLYPDEEVWTYQLHPLGALDEGYLVFTTPRAGTPTLTLRLPSDEVWAAARADWLPQGYTRARYLETIDESGMFFAFCGVAALALATVLPFRTHGRWTSWTLYTPLLTLFLGAVYEHGVTAGWRFDLYFLVLAYIIIAAGWLIRTTLVVRMRTRRPRASGGDTEGAT